MEHGPLAPSCALIDVCASEFAHIKLAIRDSAKRSEVAHVRMWDKLEGVDKHVQSIHRDLEVVKAKVAMIGAISGGICSSIVAIISYFIR